MKRLAALLCFFCFVSTAFAQERLGIANSNYAGVNGVMLNPSSIVDSRVYIDLHLVGSSFFVHNSYIFLPKDEFSFLGAIRNRNVPYPQDVLNGRKNNALMQLSVTGPSATVNFERHAIGVHTAFRSYINANNVPEAQSKFTLEGLTYRPQHAQNYTGDNISLKAMAWAEVGVSYSTIVKQDFYDFITVGATVKRMYGIAGLGFSVANYEYNVLDTADAQFFDFDMEYGLTDPGWNIGRGWGFDLGATWQKKKEPIFNYTPHSRKSRCAFVPYRWKAGLSILDIGRIKFDRNAYYNEVSNGANTWFGYDESGVNTPEEVDNLFAGLFGGNRATEFKSKMPTAVSGQFDYNIDDQFFINGTIVQRFGRLRKLGVQRPNVIAITPRYERKRFEVSMPVSLYEYRYPMVGLMLRLNSIIIGTDNLGPYFFNTDVFRMDFYFHLKYTIFKSKKCNPQGQGRYKRSKRQLKKDARACPKFNS